MADNNNTPTETGKLKKGRNAAPPPDSIKLVAKAAPVVEVGEPAPAAPKKGKQPQKKTPPIEPVLVEVAAPTPELAAAVAAKFDPAELMLTIERQRKSIADLTKRNAVLVANLTEATRTVEAANAFINDMQERAGQPVDGLTEPLDFALGAGSGMVASYMVFRLARAFF